MATLIGTERPVIDTLNHLLELEFGAAAAYEAAIQRLDDPVARDQLGQFMNDHLRHIQELGHLLRDRGRRPPDEADFKAVLTQGKVIIGGLVGDIGILSAMRSNEDGTHQAYEQALERDDLAPRLQNTLTGNLADERRHRAWLEDRLSNL